MITLYNLELNDIKLPVLIKEKEIEYKSKPLSQPDRIVELCNKALHLNQLAEEHVIALAVDTKCNALGLFRVSHGCVDSALCNPREIFIRALLVGASRVVVVHNHPSGNCEPSFEDMETKRRIEEAGNLIGIKMDDFIIIGGNSFYSFYENEMM